MYICNKSLYTILKEGNVTPAAGTENIKEQATKTATSSSVNIFKNVLKNIYHTGRVIHKIDNLFLRLRRLSVDM